MPTEPITWPSYEHPTETSLDSTSNTDPPECQYSAPSYLPGISTSPDTPRYYGPMSSGPPSATPDTTANSDAFILNNAVHFEEFIVPAYVDPIVLTRGGSTAGRSRYSASEMRTYEQMDPVTSSERAELFNNSAHGVGGSTTYATAVSGPSSRHDSSSQGGHLGNTRSQGGTSLIEHSGTPRRTRRSIGEFALELRVGDRMVYRCLGCGQDITTRNNYWRHWHETCPQNPDRRLGPNCPECGQLLSRSDNLRQHRERFHIS